MSKFLPSPLFFFPFFFIIVSMAAELGLQYPNCNSYICGSLTITYPFWKIDDQTTNNQRCGYQGFGINCSTIDNQERGTIDLHRDSYYVDYINYNSSTLLLREIDVVKATDENCPRVSHGIDLSGLGFNFSKLNLNLSFHFNCNKVPSFATEIQCLGSGKNKTCVYILGTPKTEGFDWDEYCDKEVVTTVLNTTVNNRLVSLATEFGLALVGGFELQWGSMEGCDVCEESGGRCGHNFHADNSLCFCSDGTTAAERCHKGNRINWRMKLVIGMLAGVGSMVLIICFIYYILLPSLSSCTTSTTEDDKNVEAFIMQYGSLTTKRYKYSEIKKITNSFLVQLGRGGFGSVFKGKLADGRLVAVKVLNSSKANGEEFINEVASIGRTSHVNVVALLGFCCERRKRALVYEFMPNGSLEKFIYCDDDPHPTTEPLGVDMLYKIAVGIAQGLDYLHRGCNTRILHLDIKPHNILLDEDFCPKIADFGLAKLYSRKESIVSMLEARGTIGYIAPEVFSRNFGGVSHKSDVYSYGMMILEMVGGRKNVDAGVGSGRTSEIYFPYWIYNRLEKGEVLLKGLVSKEENDVARKMIIVGLRCIQTDPSQRPSINEVIEMLEGDMEALTLPPKPFFSSPPRSPNSGLSS